MNNQQDNVYVDSLKEVRDLKARFDQLRIELKKVHEEWKKAEKPHGEDMQRLKELVDREMKLSEEVNEVIESYYQLMHSHTKRSQ